jgi:hypothetical protein
VKVNAANAIKETMSFQERINSEESKMWSELIPLKEDSDEYLAIQKKYEESIRKLKGEWFEATPAFKALFADTADMATREVQELYEKTKNLVNLIALNTTKIHRDTEGNIVGRTYTDADGFPAEYEESSFTANSAKITSVGLGGISWYNVHFKKDEAVVEGQIWCSYEAEAQVYGGDWDDGSGLDDTGYTKTDEDIVFFSILIHKEGDEIVWELV